MKNYRNNLHYRSEKEIHYKNSVSFLYQKFLSIDKRMRRNIVIGASMITVVVMTELVLALISLVQFGGSLLDEAKGNSQDRPVLMIK